MRHNRNTIRHFADTFRLFPEGAAVVKTLLDSCGEFAHLRRGRLPCVLSQRALVERGTAQPCIVMEPQGGNTSSARRLFVDWLVVDFCRSLLGGLEPDYLLLFDTALWPDKDATEAEHVVYHALCHIGQRVNEFDCPMWHDDGRAMLRLVSHDIERFTAEVQRYGETISGIQDERGIYSNARGRSLDLYAGRPGKRRSA